MAIRESLKTKTSYGPTQNINFNGEEELKLIGLLTSHAKLKSIALSAFIKKICKIYLDNDGIFPPDMLPPADLKAVNLKPKRLLVYFREELPLLERLVAEKGEKPLSRKIKEILKLYYSHFFETPVDAIKRLCIMGLDSQSSMHKQWTLISILRAVTTQKEFDFYIKTKRWDPGISPGKR